jgi:hypothetical protein
MAAVSVTGRSRVIAGVNVASAIVRPHVATSAGVAVDGLVGVTAVVVGLRVATGGSVAAPITDTAAKDMTAVARGNRIVAGVAVAGAVVSVVA